MLAYLDNEVYFTNVFTDIDVFCSLVKDVLGIDINITKVETEAFPLTKIPSIRFGIDLFAKDDENSTLVIIQKIDYDYAYDPYGEYLIDNIIEMQRNSKKFTFKKKVYVIVIVTPAYRINEKNGKPIKDDVLITDINPRTLSGEVRDMYNHKIVVLNTAHLKNDTPPEIKDWLDLIVESMKNPENPNINTRKPAIAKAAQLAELNNISPEQIAEAKIQEMKKINIAMLLDDERKQGDIKMQEAVTLTERKVRKEAAKEGIKKALKRGRLSHEEIAEDFDVTVAYVQHIEKEI
jgi:hypothetical protein